MSTRRLRLLALLIAGTALFACQDHSDPTAPVLNEPPTSLAIVDGDVPEGNPGIRFRFPIKLNEPPLPGTFDPSLPLRIEIAELGGSGAPEVYSVAAGDIHVRSFLKYYVLWWRPPETAVPGTVFRATLFAGGLELGAFADLEIAANLRDVIRIRVAGENASVLDARRFYPIRVYANTEALPFAQAQAEEELKEEVGGVDADVQVIENTTGGSVSVSSEPGSTAPPLAGELTVDPNDVVDAAGNPVGTYVLTLALLPQETKPAPPTVPGDQQFPFPLRATVTDEDGEPLRFATGASLVICQPEDLETNPNAPYFLPQPQASEQQILKIDDGVVTVLPTVYGAPECAGFQGMAPVDFRSLEGLSRLAMRGLRSLKHLAFAEPLRAGHGGLTTTKSILDLSDLTPALLTDPAVSTATVPATGTVGVATTLTVQANVTAAIPQVNGGDVVVVTVSGANAATPAVTDNGDGTYTASYTPANAGTDQIAVTIADPVTGTPTPIAGSPFTSVVSTPLGNRFFWDPVEGGNGHYYEYVPFQGGAQTWTASEAAAAALVFQGLPGHLVSITSAGEQAFVNAIRTSLGLNDWRPWIGLRDADQNGTFEWVTAEPLGYTNWGPGEPNNLGSEFWVEMFASGVWNNNLNATVLPTGYLVEYEPALIPNVFQPEVGAIIQQSNPANGCSLAFETSRGYGYIIDFDWSDVPGAVEYDVEARIGEASLPFVQQTVPASQYTAISCNAFTGDGAEATWQVRARFDEVTAGPWTSPSEFSFGPCILDDQTPCRVVPAPTPVSPADGAVVPSTQATFTWSGGTGTYKIQFQSCTTAACDAPTDLGTVDVTGTSYTTDLEGMDFGRWRVWSVDGPHPSRQTDWRTFQIAG